MSKYTFIHPAPGSKVTSSFGRRKDPFTGQDVGHQGIDYAKSGNVPILAAADGIVKQYTSDNTTYGKVLYITHTINGKQMDTTYAHLKSKTVKAGDKVKQGQIIGYMGSTGRSTGQHLHFEVHDGPWKSGQGNAVNPENYVNKYIAPVVQQTVKKKLYLPATASSWAVYPLDKAPVKANAIASLNPKKFGGLNYEIIGNPQKDVYTISTSNFGLVNIYAAKSTGAIIK